MRSQKGGCCSISDDWSCTFTLIFALPVGVGSALLRKRFNFKSVIILASLLVFPMLDCRHSLLRHCNFLRFFQVECTFSNIPTFVHLLVEDITFCFQRKLSGTELYGVTIFICGSLYLN